MLKKYLLVLLIPFFMACENSTKQVTEDVEETEEVIQTPVLEKEEKEEENPFLLENMLKITDEAMLKSKYGAENVIRETQVFAEGTVELEVTLLFKGTEKELRFMWEDDSVNFATPSSLFVEAKNSPWITSNGIKVGTKMTELEKIYNSDFEFYGFGWDFGGMVIFDKNKIVEKSINLTLGACSDSDYDKPEYAKLLGDAEFKSSSTDAQAFNPCVVGLEVHSSLE
jgi:hypothetical protein